MNLINSLKIVLWGIAALFIMTGCSSSSSSTRYNKPKVEDSEKGSSVRFTSKDESPKHNNIPPADRYNNQPEFDEKPIEEYPVDTKEFVKKFEKFGGLSSALTQREKVLFEIIRFIDTPYLYGGDSEQGIDCSAFTRQVMKNTLEIDLPRTAGDQFSIGEKISDKTLLQFGDLIFFNTRSRSNPGHVGIYIGEDLFAHASRIQGVIVSSMKSSYYKKRFVGGRRLQADLE